MGELALEELGGHGRLAVRREGEGVPGGVLLHEREVVLKALGGEGEHGGGEAAGEEVAALRGELADGQPVGVRRQRLEAVVDPLVGEACDGVRAPVGGGGLVSGLVGGHGAPPRLFGPVSLALPELVGVASQRPSSRALHNMQRSLRMSLTAV
ncbi:hypothetical protein SMD44_05576 [Streptomyces alboflavus]|uniref:Uncharacterized protein n=1 Tax=Streptomyces alboflavus TaxID=67267 RepID=A0A1Z1WI38_9ACTN|nr:hypothetical protein SMD44_05576 [Streptomyces alboflavus]